YINTASAAISWTVSDVGSGGVQSAWRVDSGAWSPFAATLTATVTGLTAGSHRIEVEAEDAVGNVSGGGCAISTQGLVSWWKGDGDAGDAVGANGGIEGGGVTYAAGKSGQAFLFNGTSANVLVNDNPNLDPGSGSFTLEAWVKIPPGS